MEHLRKSYEMEILHLSILQQLAEILLNSSVVSFSIRKILGKLPFHRLVLHNLKIFPIWLTLDIGKSVQLFHMYMIHHQARLKQLEGEQLVRVDLIV